MEYGQLKFRKVWNEIGSMKKRKTSISEEEFSK